MQKYLEEVVGKQKEGEEKEFWKTEAFKQLKARIAVLQKDINMFAENDLCKLS